MVGRKYVAEAAGTFILVFFAVGSAIFGIKTIGEAGVAFAFGLVLVALAYGIGPVSGCHVNPAVTLGVLLARRMSPREAGGYVAAQIVGAIIAGGTQNLLQYGVGIGSREPVRRHRRPPGRLMTIGRPRCVCRCRCPPRTRRRSVRR